MPDRAVVARIEQVAVAVAEVADAIRTEDEQGVLGRVARWVAQLIPGVIRAAVLLREPGRWRSVSTDEGWSVPETVECDSGAGPSVHAIESGRIVRAERPHLVQRWPEYAATVLQEYPVGAVLACPSVTEDGADTSCAINLFADNTDAFDAFDQALLRLYLQSVWPVFTSARELEETKTTVAQLRQAVASRDLIGMAKGVLMAGHRLSPDEAFGMLVDESQRSNRKLREVAELVLRSLPERSHPDSDT